MRNIVNIQIFRTDSDRIEDDNMEFVKSLHYNSYKSYQYHYFINKNGDTHNFKSISTSNKLNDNLSIDIIISGKDKFSVQTLNSLKYLIYNLRKEKYLNIIINQNFDNFNVIQQNFNIY